MENKLNEVFTFLKDNRIYNSNFHVKSRNYIMGSFQINKEKVYAQLFEVFHSQSQPKLDYGKKFFKDLTNNMSVLKSFNGFANYLGCEDSDQPYQSLYNGLRNKAGWGQKTSALFVKNVYQIHNHKEMKAFAYWKDAPVLLEGDRLFLPVDAVILAIFYKLNGPSGFDSINNLIAKQFEGKAMEVWDDLWFWGFITQRGSKKEDRKHQFNEGKYWSLLHSDKNPKMIEEIKGKCKEFIGLLK